MRVEYKDGFRRGVKSFAILMISRGRCSCFGVWKPDGGRDPVGGDSNATSLWCCVGC